MLSSKVKIVLDSILSDPYPCAVEKFSILEIRSKQEKQLEMSSDMHRSNTQELAGCCASSTESSDHIVKKIKSVCFKYYHFFTWRDNRIRQKPKS